MLAVIIMKISYKKELTAFIDVLGFSEIVLKSDKTKLEDYFSILDNQLKGLSKNGQLKYFLISDTIILTATNNLPRFINLLSIIQYIQALLLSKGILVRGSITVDEIYLNRTKNIIVGPSLVNAYNLEGLAKYPRIIIDRKIIDNFSFDGTVSLLSYVNNHPLNIKRVDYLLQLDTDNYIYVNYIACFVDKSQNYQQDGFANIYKIIRENIYSNKNLDKYNWINSKIVFELTNLKTYLNNLSAQTPSTKHLKNLKMKGVENWLNRFIGI